MARPGGFRWVFLGLVVVLAGGACRRKARLNPGDPLGPGWIPTPTRSLTPSATPTIPAPDALEEDDSYGSAGTIALGQRQDRNIRPIADPDWATFTLSAWTEITVETTGLSGDTVLTLYDSTGTGILASDDDGGVGLFSRIVLGLGPGTYYVRVDEKGNDGIISSYELALEDRAMTATATSTETPTFTITPTLTPTPFLLDDFEDGDLDTTQGWTWFSYDDGNLSAISQTNVAGGANGTARALRVQGTLSSSIFAWTTWRYGFVGAGVTLDPSLPAPLYKSLGIWLKGDWATGVPAANAELWVGTSNGHWYVRNFTPDLNPTTWTAFSFDLGTGFVPQGAYQWSTEMGNINAVFIPFSFAFTNGTFTDTFDFYIDEIQFYRH